MWVLLAVDVMVSYGANFQLFFTEFVYAKTDDGWKYVGRKDSVLVSSKPSPSLQLQFKLKITPLLFRAFAL